MAGGSISTMAGHIVEDGKTGKHTGMEYVQALKAKGNIPDRGISASRSPVFTRGPGKILAFPYLVSFPASPPVPLLYASLVCTFEAAWDSLS